MPKINIDEVARNVCEPIEIIVSDKSYTVIDIPLPVIKKMNNLTGTDKAGDPDALVEVISEILNADKKDISKLGIRKLTLLIERLMGELNKEIESKNVQKAEVKKSQ